MEHPGSKARWKCLSPRLLIISSYRCCSYALRETFQRSVLSLYLASKKSAERFSSVMSVHNKYFVWPPSWSKKYFREDGIAPRAFELGQVAGESRRPGFL